VRWHAHRPLRLSAWTVLPLLWAGLSCAIWLSAQAGSPAQAEPVGALAWLDWLDLQEGQCAAMGLSHHQPWRWWTAALVHWSGLHLLVNLLGGAALIAWGNAAGLQQRHAFAWWLAWPCTQLLLGCLANLPHYGGLSGVLHAGVAIGCWALLRQPLAQRRWVGGMVLLGLCLKVAFEQGPVRRWWGLASAAPALIGAPGWVVAGAVHESGVMAGLACALLVDCAAAALALLSRDAPPGKAAGR